VSIGAFCIQIVLIFNIVSNFKGTNLEKIFYFLLF
jgi:hypothetical protein